MFIRLKDFNPSLREGDKTTIDRGMNPLGILMFSGDKDNVKVTIATVNQKHKDVFDKHKGMALCKGLLDSKKIKSANAENLEELVKDILSTRVNPIPYSSRIENFTKVFIRKITNPFPPKV
jgi:hypothetical protein